jgi:hypothetical protein
MIMFIAPKKKINQSNQSQKSKENQQTVMQNTESTA